MTRLDARDIEILKILSREGRISKADLAARINLSASPAWERLKRLEAAGVITCYRAEVALKRIAPHVTIFVTLELDRHDAGSFRTFETLAEAEPQITACWALGGGFDYLVQVVTRDIDSYQRLMDDLLDRGAGIARYYTYVVTKTLKSGASLPFDVLLAPDRP